MSATSASLASQLSGLPVSAMMCTPTPLRQVTVLLSSLVSPELEMAITTSPGLVWPAEPCTHSVP